MSTTNKKTILLKLSGELLSDQHQKTFSCNRVNYIISQMGQLKDTIRWAMVIGGGNIFRGGIDAKAAGISEQTGHRAGMLATMINGIMLQDLCEQQGLRTSIISSIECAVVGDSSSEALATALQTSDVIIFVGGLGVPYFTTDTAAVVRALQIKAHELWKATKVDGIYNRDPVADSHAQLLTTVSYQEYLDLKLKILDTTAIVLAQSHNLPIKVFSHQAENNLLQAAHNKSYGSIITKE